MQNQLRMKFSPFSLQLSHFTFICGIALISLPACDKSDDADADADSLNSSFVNVAPAVSDGAVLVAARSHTKQASPAAGIPDIDIQLDIPVAIFYSNGNQVAAGTVSIDDTELDYLNNIYTLQTGGFTPGSQQFMYGDRTWTVTGEGNSPSGTFANTRNLPSLGNLTAEETVVRGEAYTISVASATQADSLIYLIGERAKTVSSTTRSVTFSADETSALSTGTNVVQVAAYNITEQSSGSQRVYLINEDVRQLTVDIQ